MTKHDLEVAVECFVIFTSVYLDDERAFVYFTDSDALSFGMFYFVLFPLVEHVTATNIQVVPWSRAAPSGGC